MRTNAGIFFSLLYLMAMLRPVAPFMEYYLRYEYFSKKLCVNLNRPEMKCNGQCVLMQRLKKVVEEKGFPERPASANNVNWTEYPVGFVVLLQFSTSPTDCSELSCVPHYIARLLSGFVSLPDYPPKLSV